MNPILRNYLKKGLFQFVVFFLVLFLLGYDKGIPRLLLFSFIQALVINAFNYFYETRKKN